METQVEIIRMGLEGQGVGYDDAGNIYFVPRAVVGDKVRVITEEEKKKYRDAQIVEVVSPAGTRVDSPCKYFQQCGGCDWLNWDYASQLAAKEEIVKHVLERGELHPAQLLPIRKAEQTLHYRNRIQVRRHSKKTGFFRRKTHELIDVEECKIASPAINEELKNIRSEKVDPNEIMKIELFLDRDGKVHRFDNVAHSFSGFAQIHTGQNEKLRKMVRERIERYKSQRVLELYCGDGNLTFAYLDQVTQVCGVDASKPAIESARIQRPSEYQSSALFFADKVDANLLRRLPQEMMGYDTLIVDPPRQGMLGTLNKFIQDQLKTVIYISCSPVTFTQDVQCLKKDFQLVSVEPIDMFPNTRHVELVATWVRA